MDKFALFVTLHAKKGKEKDVEKFLSEAVPLVEQERTTSTWHALRIKPGMYMIFDTFPDEASRQAHLTGKIAKALVEKSSELLSQAPTIEPVDIIAVKMPEVVQY